MNIFLYIQFPNTKLVILGRGDQQADIIETADHLKIKDKIVYRFDFVSEIERLIHMLLLMYVFSRRLMSLLALSV